MRVTFDYGNQIPRRELLDQRPLLDRGQCFAPFWGLGDLEEEKLQCICEARRVTISGAGFWASFSKVLAFRYRPKV